MQPACIRHTDLPGTSRLFADFSYHFEQVAEFYGHDPQDPESFRRAAAEIHYPAERRAALVSALAAQNGDSASLRLLAQPGTMVVATGQQVGLFSGPAYTIYKAITAARVAKQLTDAGTPAVAVFWLATEDHDFAEVDHAWMFDAQSQASAVRVDSAAEAAGRQRPVGKIRLSKPPIAELRAALAGLPFTDEVVAAVERAYPQDVTMGAGFHALLKVLLAKFDVLFLDPLDPAIRQISAPLMAQALADAPELKARLGERNAALTAAGYHAQVHLDEKTSLFFLLKDGERIPLRRNGSEKEPADDADLSPNALLRPVMQDYLLPTLAFIGGPGELAYLAQSQVLYQHLLGRMPVVMARSGFTILDKRSQKLLERYRMTVAQTLCSEGALRDRIAQELVPDSLGRSMDSAASDITQRVDRLRAELAAFDPTLAAALDKSGSKIAYQLAKMRKKTEREALRRDQRATADAQHLSAMLFPHRHLQERFYSILPMLAEHGMALIDQIYEASEPHCPDHRVYAV